MSEPIPIARSRDVAPWQRTRSNKALIAIFCTSAIPLDIERRNCLTTDELGLVASCPKRPKHRRPAFCTSGCPCFTWKWFRSCKNTISHSSRTPPLLGTTEITQPAATPPIGCNSCNCPLPTDVKTPLSIQVLPWVKEQKIPQWSGKSLKWLIYRTFFLLTAGSRRASRISWLPIAHPTSWCKDMRRSSKRLVTARQCNHWLASAPPSRQGWPNLDTASATTFSYSPCSE